MKVFMCEDSNVNILTHLKFTYITQMEHAIARFLALSVSDCDVAEKLDAVWTVCLGKDHLELWDKRLAQAFAQLDLPIEWTLVGDILQKGAESCCIVSFRLCLYGRRDGTGCFLPAFTFLFYTRCLLPGIPRTFMISSGNVIMIK